MNKWIIFFGVLIVVGFTTWYFLKSAKDTCEKMKKEKHKRKPLYEIYKE